MYKIIPPLYLEMQGEDVANLQFALKILQEKRPFRIRDREQAENIEANWDKEVGNSFYGKATYEIVRLVQETNGLEISGEVNERTADVLNNILKEVGELSEPDDKKDMLVSGHVISPQLQGVPGQRLLLVDKNVGGDVPLSEGVSGEDGTYEIRYTLRERNKEKPDIQVKVLDADNTLLAVSMVCYNADSVESELDIMIPEGKLDEPSEYDRLFGELSKVLPHQNKAELEQQLSKLQEDDKQQDLTYLAGKTGESSERIAFIVASHIFYLRTMVAPEIFYAFLRNDLPANLPALLMQDREVLLTVVETAISDRIIPSHFGENIDTVLDSFRKLLVQEAIISLSNEDEQNSLAVILDSILPGTAEKTDFLNRYATHAGSIQNFWSKLHTTSLKNKADELQFTFQVSALTGNYLPLIKEFQRMRLEKETLSGTRHKIETFADLVYLDEEGWRILLTKPYGEDTVQVPAGIAGDNEQKQNYYIAILMMQLENLFPTKFVYARLKEETGLDNQMNLLTFFEKNQDNFEINGLPLKNYLQDHPKALDSIAEKDRPVVEERISTMQRLYKVAPQYRVMRTLMKNGINSAHDITRMGSSLFALTVGNKLIQGNKYTSSYVFNRSEQVVEISAALSFSLTEDNLKLQAINGKDIQQKLASKEGIADWQTLFGSLEFCDCEHCRSVYSPAAYFVDILCFLDERKIIDPKLIQRDKFGRINSVKFKYVKTENGKSREKSVEDVLFERRADLAEIELTCQNTNTPLPYIDLVNEALETYVAQPAKFNKFILDSITAGQLDSQDLAVYKDKYTAIEVVKQGKSWRLYDRAYTYTVRKSKKGIQVETRGRQTSGSSQELAANPQYLNPDAYDKLKKSVFPIALPFDLWREEACIYLDHLKLPRYQIMEAFLHWNRQELLKHKDIGYEYLGLTQVDAGLIAGAISKQDGADEEGIWNLWGFNKERGAKNIPDPADSTKWVNDIETLNPKNPKEIIKSNYWVDILTGRTDVFLQQSGLKYKEMLALLDTYFINSLQSDGKRTITLQSRFNEAADTCETQKLWLSGMNKNSVWRSMQFIRLWRKLGWNMQDLDRSLTVLGINGEDAYEKIKLGTNDMTPLDTDPDLLIKLSHIDRLHKSLNLPVEKLLPFWGDIDSAHYIDHETKGQPSFPTLYEKLFLNKGVINPPDVAFNKDPSLVAVELYDKDNKLTQHASSISGALGIDAKDFALLIDQKNGVFLKPDPVVLNLRHLSQLYRHATLLQALKLPVRDYLSAIKLSFDPFSSPARTLEFVEQVNAVQQSSLTLVELDYLSRHRIIETARVAPLDEEIALVLTNMQSDLQRIIAETTFKEDKKTPEGPTIDLRGDLTRKTLAQLGYKSDKIDEIIETFNGARTYGVALNKLPNGITLPNDTGIYRVKLDKIPHGFAFPDSLSRILTLDYKFLFSIGLNLIAKLDQQILSTECIEKFDENKHKLTNQAVVHVVQKGYSWRITDANTKKYIIRKKASTLIISDESSVILAANRLLSASEIELLNRIGQTTTSQSLRNAFAELLAMQDKMRGRIFYTKKMLHFEGVMTDARKKYLEESCKNHQQCKDAITKLYNAPRNFLKDTINVEIVSLFQETITPEKRFADLLKKLMPRLQLLLGQRAIIQILAEALGLETQTVHDLLTSWLTRQGQQLIKVFLEKEFTANNAEIKVTHEKFEEQFNAYLLLHKNALVINRFNCTSQQAQWLFAYAVDAKWPNLSTLPVKEAEVHEAKLDYWLRLVELFDLRNDLPRGEDMLNELLNLSKREGTSKETYLNELEKWTEWSTEDLGVLLGQKDDPHKTGLLKATFPNNYKGAELLARLQNCFKLSGNLGLSATQCKDLVENDMTQKDTEAIKQAVRAKYEDSQWFEIAHPLRDVLRKKQRDALVSYLLVNPSLKHKWRKISDIYSYFLLDIEMNPCQMTTRIKQALSSVQIFVQRCQMQLESEVFISAETDLKWKEWRWMKNYRVWEANRKIFLYPENWIEPELRDDKSPFFQTMESELLQNNLTLDTAESVFRRYLENLNSVARLEVAGMYHEQKKDTAGNIIDHLHVFGRTSGIPHNYYYRRRVNKINWTAWEKVDLDINGDHLIPVVWLERLFLIWPIFTKEAEGKNQNSNNTILQERWKIQLGWSEYKDGKWLSKKMSEDALLLKYATKLQDKKQFYFRVNSDVNRLDIHTFLRQEKKIWILNQQNLMQNTDIKVLQYSTFTFSGCNASFTVDVDNDKSGNFSIKNSNSVQHGYTQPFYMMLKTGSGKEIQLPRGENDDLYSRALHPNAQNGDSKILVIPQSSINEWSDQLRQHPWFFNDSVRTYFVEPTIQNVPYDDPQSSQETIPGPDTTPHPPIFKFGSGRMFEQEELIPFYNTFGPRVDAGVNFPEINPGDPLHGQQMYGTTGLQADELYQAYQVNSAGVGHHLAATNKVTPEDLQQTNPLSKRPEMTTYSAPIQYELVIASMEARDSKTARGLIESARQIGTGSVKRRDEYRYTFHTFFHPYLCSFLEALNLNGIDGLMQRPMQLQSDLPNKARLDGKKEIFKTKYNPVTKDAALVDTKYPVEDVDFSLKGAYSQYNWELFFHAPLMIADSLRKNQRFSDAQHWFHYIFDPTDTSSLEVPERYWRTKPFYEKKGWDYQRHHIHFILRLLAANGNLDTIKNLPDFNKIDQAKLMADYQELLVAVQAWRSDPFKPHLVARMRNTAYQKTVVMKYIDNLIAWGDQLFRRDTMESINEATHLYVLASDILGERPDDTPPRITPDVQTYASLKPILGKFRNAQVASEGYVPPSGLTSFSSNRAVNTASPHNLLMLNFCMPENSELIAYWDTVADRLFKIRNCMNIKGTERQLPMFSPPINPALLVKATAAGLDIDSVLNDISAPLSPYRFNILSQKATELCSELKSLGASLLAAMEKKDAEKLALLRAEHETTLLKRAEEVRKKQVKEADQQIEALKASREIALTRIKHYRDLLGTIEKEKIPAAPSSGDSKVSPISDLKERPYANTLKRKGVKLILNEVKEFELLEFANKKQKDASEMEMFASISNAFPTASLSCGVGCSVGSAYGGQHMGAIMSAIAASYRNEASDYSYNANRASRMGQHIMREDDWILQHNLAAKEISHIDQQIIASYIRKEITEKELANHRKQAEQSQKVEETMRDKYTNQQLYSWMIGQISNVYFQAYQLAFDVSKRAERAFRHELGLTDSSYIDFGYWDSLKKGLLAGERLHQDIKDMEVAYLNQHHREHELIEDISLMQLDPAALIQFKQTGSCFVNIPEAWFDLKSPGHYMRRIKSVSLTIPCVTGPYTGVNCTLTLVRNSVRHTNTLLSGKYARDLENEDQRFIDNLGAMQSIVTSKGQNDSGMFETNLRDERFLPFEGAGVISSWKMELPDTFRQFDYDTISDVIMHINYTARPDSGLMKQKSIGELQEAVNEIARISGKPGLARLFSIRHEFGNEWHNFLYPKKDDDPHLLTLSVGREHFPFLFSDRIGNIDKIEIFLKIYPSFAGTYNETTLKLALKKGTSTPNCNNPVALSKWNGLLRAESEGIELGKWTMNPCLEGKGHLEPEAFEDIMVVYHYTISSF